MSDNEKKDFWSDDRAKLEPVRVLSAHAEIDSIGPGMIAKMTICGHYVGPIDQKEWSELWGSKEGVTCPICFWQGRKQSD